MSKRRSIIIVRESEIQGRGVFARRRIKRGRKIVEYTGERITPEEETRRYDDEAMERHHTFLFHVDEETTIDGDVGGSDARFINHSCDPNCEAIDDDGRIYIHALKTIHPGEELLYDYNFELDDDDDSDEIIKRYVCHCGSPNCRGTIVNTETE